MGNKSARTEFSNKDCEGFAVWSSSPLLLNLSLISHEEGLCSWIPHAILALCEPVNKTQMLILMSTAFPARKWIKHCENNGIVHRWVRQQETVGQSWGPGTREGSKTRKRDAKGRRRNKTTLECIRLDLSVSFYGQHQAMTITKDYLVPCACSVWRTFQTCFLLTMIYEAGSAVLPINRWRNQGSQKLNTFAHMREKGWGTCWTPELTQPHCAVCPRGEKCGWVTDCPKVPRIVGAPRKQDLHR